MDKEILNRIRGVAVGAAVGDALGMPLEFLPRRQQSDLVTEMLPGRIQAGSFTDDTEMALALAESLIADNPLNPIDLSSRFISWMKANPPDIGNHTRAVLNRLAAGESWKDAAAAVQHANPTSAGNGSVMRCWPVALARWNNLAALVQESILQSEVTHPHPECSAGCAFVNVTISYLVQGKTPSQAFAQAEAVVDMPHALRVVISNAARKPRDELPNSGWVRHTLESAVWTLLTTANFESALISAVNLGNDADTTGTVVGALAGAAYGIDTIPQRWQDRIQGEFPLQSGKMWDIDSLINLADALVNLG